MAEAIVLGLARKISGYIGALAVEQVVSWWGVKDDLTKLDESIRIIKAVLTDADHKQQVQGITDALSNEWLRRLRRVLYQADDLFDEVFTVKQQMAQSLKEGNRVNQVAKKVLSPFSKSGPIRFNVYVAGEIKSIRKELDAIKGDLDLSAFNLAVSGRGESMPLMTCSRNKWETASSVNPQNIVGREHDKNDIIEMLLSESDIAEGSISVIPIVGFGGIGKTTLAQLVFNDDRVKNHFKLAKWVWVPEKDNKNEMMGKIFKAFTGRDYHGLSLEQLKSDIRDSIKGKRYLLVLDDVWDESRRSWLDLMDLLCCGERESKIIVTTRSLVVANNVGTLPRPYAMQFLSDEESWDLFQKLAFKPGSNPNLIPIGKEIVKKCGNVPFAIRAIGSALYSKDKEIEWTQFKDVKLSKIDQTGSIDIMPALKLSYNQLPYQLKQCFAYCAVFKKRTSFLRRVMVNEWIAQGFIQPSNEDCNLDLEDVGHRYFEELSSRNFFQDTIPCDDVDDVEFSIHDLMMDLAAHVAGDEILHECASLMMNDVKEQFHGDPRHLVVYVDTSDLWEAPLLFPQARKMRSLSIGSALENNDVCYIGRLENMLSNFIHLRYLDLARLMIEMVPDSIGELRHLRYLYIFKCPAIKCLPPSIKKLWNLQTLILEHCRKLETLPTGFSRLINLRWLCLEGCNLLIEIPAGFQKLKSLKRLSHFVVGKNNGLDALADMNLRGDLEIAYHRWRKDTISEARTANSKGKQQLSMLTLRLGSLDISPCDAVSLLEELQPPQNLKRLQIVGYQGERLCCWMGVGLHTWLPNLVEITLESFKRCRFLSSGFSQLPFLRSLDLSEFTTLKYIETRGKGIRVDKYFPCLEYLKLSKLPQLRGWFRVALKEEDDIDGNEEEEDEEDGDGSDLLMFPCLETLEIYECPELISMPLTSRLQTLVAKDVHWSLLVGEKAATRFCFGLTVLDLSSVPDLSVLVLNSILSLKTLKMSDCLQLTSVTVAPPSSINHISIKGCRRLREIQGLHHLSSSLDYLYIKDCEGLDKLPTDLGSLIALQLLQIWKLPKLTALPLSISRLSALRHLNIAYCPGLTSLPDIFDNLTQLRFLQIGACPKMSSYIESSSFADLLRHFTLLEKLYLGGFPNLTALPESIGHLPYLHELKIGNCTQLTVLPDWFPKLPALQTLNIFGCPHLNSRCKEPDGEDLPLIRHIPNVIFED